MAFPGYRNDQFPSIFFSKSTLAIMSELWVVIIFTDTDVRCDYFHHDWWCYPHFCSHRGDRNVAWTTIRPFPIPGVRRLIRLQVWSSRLKTWARYAKQARILSKQPRGQSSLSQIQSRSRGFEKGQSVQVFTAFSLKALDTFGNDCERPVFSLIVPQSHESVKSLDL